MSQQPEEIYRFRSIPERFLAALHYQDYRTLWTANMFAGAAAWALIVARGWLAFDITETNSNLWVGVVTFMAMAPRFFLTPFIGFIADRFDRQTVLSWSYTLNLVHSAILALLVMFGEAGIWHLVVLSLVNGSLRSVQQTTTQSLVPNLVPRDRLLNAVALNQATQQGSRLVGPLAILPLLAFFDVSAAFGCAVPFTAWDSFRSCGSRPALAGRSTPTGASSTTWPPASSSPTTAPCY